MVPASVALIIQGTNSPLGDDCSYFVHGGRDGNAIDLDIINKQTADGLCCDVTGPNLQVGHAGNQPAAVITIGHVAVILIRGASANKKPAQIGHN
jgi:hypothetical protein